jgi:hypothetical protein
VVGFDPACDESLRRAYNEIFVDHWGSVPRDPDHWRTWFTGHRAFRPYEKLGYRAVSTKILHRLTTATPTKPDDETPPVL